MRRRSFVTFGMVAKVVGSALGDEGAVRIAGGDVAVRVASGDEAVRVAGGDGAVRVGGDV